MFMRAMANDTAGEGITTLEINGAGLSAEKSASAVDALRKIFDRAKENAPAIIFIDEIDTVMQKRGGMSDPRDQLIGAMLEEMDGIKKYSNVLVIAATNMPDNLDPALLRRGRFDRAVFARPPDSGERAKLFEMYLRNVPLDDELDLGKLGLDTEGFTGADIASVCKEAKIAALEESVKAHTEVKVSMKILERVVGETAPGAAGASLTQCLDFMSRHDHRR